MKWKTRNITLSEHFQNLIKNRKNSGKIGPKFVLYRTTIPTCRILKQQQKQHTVKGTYSFCAAPRPFTRRFVLSQNVYIEIKQSPSFNSHNHDSSWRMNAIKISSKLFSAERMFSLSLFTIVLLPFNKPVESTREDNWYPIPIGTTTQFEQILYHENVWSKNKTIANTVTLY